MPTDRILSLDAAATDETIGVEIPVDSFDRVGWDAVWSSGCSAGVVTVEWAPISGYTGDWKSIETLNFLDDGCDGGSIESLGGFYRPRISTAVANGTVTFYMKRGNIGHY